MLAAGIDLAVVVVLVVGVVIGRSLWTFFFSKGSAMHLQWPARLGLASVGGVVLAVYLAFGWARSGRTVGKRVLGLSLVTSAGGGVPVSLAVLRAVLYVIFPVGLLWCSVSRTRSSVQDLLLRTAVVYDWHGSGLRGRNSN
jgi:uncharacterized RDD family membrane protein YckC